MNFLLAYPLTPVYVGVALAICALALATRILRRLHHVRKAGADNDEAALKTKPLVIARQKRLRLGREVADGGVSSVALRTAASGIEHPGAG
jgi:hypothetical protein